MVCQLMAAAHNIDNKHMLTPYQSLNEANYLHTDLQLHAVATVVTGCMDCGKHITHAQATQCPLILR